MAREHSVMFLVAGAFFLEMLDGTVIATAAPSMARSFGVQSGDIGVAMTAYLVTAGALIPVSGWLATRWGPRRTFAGAVGLFTVASALCAASTSLLMLTGMRVLQGAAGALMVPVGRLAVLQETPKDQIIRVMAYLTWPGLVAPVVAPVVGGLFATYLSWHWIFLLNVPLGIVALGAALRLMPRGTHRRPDRLDVRGLLLSVVGLAALTIAGALAAEPASGPAAVAATVLGAAVLAAAVRHLARAAHPLVDLGAFRIRTFRVVHAGGSLFRVVVFGVPFVLPLLFQDGFGWSAAEAGAMVVFVFVGNLAIKPATTGLLRTFGFRTVILGAGVGVIVTLVLMGLLTAGTSVVTTAALLVLAGAFRSIGLTGYSTLAFADVPAASMTHANTLSSTVHQLAAGVAVSLAAAALSVGVRTAGGADGPAPYRIAFWVLAGVALVPLLEAWLLPRDAGVSVTRRETS